MGPGGVGNCLEVCLSVVRFGEASLQLERKETKGVIIREPVEFNDIGPPVVQGEIESNHVRMNPLAVSRLLGLLVEDGLGENRTATVESRICVCEVRQERMEVTLVVLCLLLLGFRLLLLDLRDRIGRQVCLAFLQEEPGRSFPDLDSESVNLSQSTISQI